MISKLNNKLLIAGLVLASLIAFSTIYVFAQNGSNTTVAYSEEDEVTLVGTISSIDDRGFTLTADSESYYVPLPYTFDRSLLNLAIGSEVTVIGYIVESPNNTFSSYPLVHATSINGITIDHESQLMTRSRDCDGKGGMGGNGSQGPHGNGDGMKG